MEKVLIFISHYLPGYKMGGPINSIHNIVLKLSDNYDFYILTSDRDLGESQAYPDILKHTWIKGNTGTVMYMNPVEGYYWNIVKHLRNNHYETIYLNSFFDFRFSIFIVILNYLKVIKSTQIIVAPRGELFNEALGFGRFKKVAYLKLVNFFRLYRNCLWHSTGEAETESIESNFRGSKIKLAKVISDNFNDIHNIEEPTFLLSNENLLKIIFLSRVSKDKNLPYALSILSKVSCFVEFHIYGPIEDSDIWEKCLKQTQQLPSNVKVQYKGSVEKKYVKTYFSKYDIFLLPTHRENFGHVISESLSVGTPVLISDSTPWRNLKDKSLGWDINLQNEEYFVEVINQYSKKTDSEKREFRENVIKSYASSSNQEEVVKENIKLFKRL